MNLGDEEEGLDKDTVQAAEGAATVKD